MQQNLPRLLASPEYVAEQKRLHAVGNYGTAALKYGQVVSGLANSLRIQSILDYGCGSKRSLLKVLEPDHEVRYQGYDPAIPEYHIKEPADLVVSIDVLEHIEPELLDNVLDDLQSLSPNFAFFTVHTGPANKVLSDGRNAHLIQEPARWWLPRFLSRWDLLSFAATPNGFNVVLKAL